MVRIEQIAAAALAGEALELRALVQEWLAQTPCFQDVPRPQSNDAEVLAVAASLVELFAERANQLPPSWTREIGPLEKPRFLVRSALTMKHLRRLCETESPDPLRRRNLLAPPEFLRFA